MIWYQELLEWVLKYWIAFTVGILIPAVRWFHGKLKHQDKLTRDVEDLKEKFEKMDDKFDKVCQEQKQDRQMIISTLTAMQQESMNRHLELKQEIGNVRTDTAVNKARLEKD